MPDNCNLTADRVTKVLTGTAGKDTTVQINNLDGGNALFVTISYDGNEIAAGKASATFTIKAGDKKLSYVYEGSSAGDQITITDPCDTILDAFPCDPGNFRIDRTVVGLAVQVTGGDLTVKAGK